MDEIAEALTAEQWHFIATDEILVFTHILLSSIGDLAEFDPGRVAYGSRGLPRSGAPPDCVLQHHATRDGSKSTMRPLHGRYTTASTDWGFRTRTPPEAQYDYHFIEYEF